MTFDKIEPEGIAYLSSFQMQAGPGGPRNEGKFKFNSGKGGIRFSKAKKC